MRDLEEIVREYARASCGFDASIDTGGVFPATGAGASPAGAAIFENPVCGDWFAPVPGASGEGLSLRWKGEGCGLMCASASLLCRAGEGASPGVLAAFIAYAAELARGGVPLPADDIRVTARDGVLLAVMKDYPDCCDLDDEPACTALRVLAAFAAKPVRRECVLLPWNAFGEVLRQTEISRGRA